MSAEISKPSTATMSGKIVKRLGSIVVSSLETTAQISLGQGLLKAVDRVLWMVEKSVQWSLPVHEENSEENGKAFGKIELVRPLPWILFLPSLVMLRACRLGINAGAVIFGYPKLQTTGMVKLIQKGRRRLRAIKSSGLKNMRYRKGTRNTDDELNETKKSLIKSMLSTLSALSCLETSRRTPSPTPTRVYVQHRESDTTPTPEEQSTTESTSPQVDSKRKYSQVSGFDDSSEQSEEDDEESTITKLERLAAEDSDADDHDFDPTEEELLNSESTSSDDEDDDEEYLSYTEILDLHEASNLKPVAPVAEVIVEEPEPEPEPEPEVKVEAEAVPDAVNKISTSNKKTEEEKTLGDHESQLAKETEDKVRDEPVITPVATDPVTPGRDGENTGDFYSPINSPADSIVGFKSPADNDAKDTTSVEDPHVINTPSKNSLIGEPASQLDNDNLDSSGTSTISGNSPVGSSISPATTNGTNSEKRSIATGKYHRKGKHNTGSSQRKEK